MKKILKEIRDWILEIILKNIRIISIVITVIIISCFSGTLIKYFEYYKKDILSMLIGIAGTLFGFILTFLSIFIVFKTDDKYKITKENENNPLILYINNESFLQIYQLFMNSSYLLGGLLIISIIYYFTVYGLNYIVNFIFIVIIIELITESVIRILLSIYTFNLFINMLIRTNSKQVNGRE